ncbi:MAG: PP0621 family protein [Pseudomonadota bacterium]
MSFIRFLLIVLLIWVIALIVRGYLQRSRAAKKKPARIGTMVRCAQCGLHVPESEALRRGDDYYCSVQHLPGDVQK